MQDLNNPLFDSNVDDRLKELSPEDQLFFREVLENMHQKNEELLKELERLQPKKTQKRCPLCPLNEQIYQALIKEAYGPDYISVRLRIGFCLLTISGLTINELLKLKVHVIKTLVEEGWVSISREKPGHGNKKAFLNREGKKFIQDRRKDFDHILLLKEEEDFIFSSQKNHKRSLSRESFTREINKVMDAVSNQLLDKPHVTSHSFKVGYIENLWKDFKDIKFVKYEMGKREI